MKKTISTIATLCVTAVTAFAQTTTTTSVDVTTNPAPTVSIPASLPIGSPEQLTAFAVGQVDHGYISHSSNTMLSNSNTISFLQVQNKDIGGLLVGLANANASFDVANTDDAVFTYVNVMNADWETMFSGYRPNGVLTKVNGAWKLPTTPIVMKISDYIPLKFPGAYSAELIVRDEWGNVSDYRRLNAGNDEIQFQTNLAGWGTEMIVYHNSGSVAYSVPNGGRMITPLTVTGTTPVSIENMLTFNDASLNPVITNYGMNLSCGYDVKGGTNAPLMHMVLGKARSITLGANAFALDANKPFLKPTKYVIYQFSSGELANVSEVMADSNGFATVSFPVGTYEITPIFPGELFKKKTLPDQGYIYGSGGGKG